MYKNIVSYPAELKDLYTFYSTRSKTLIYNIGLSRTNVF